MLINLQLLEEGITVYGCSLVPPNKKKQHIEIFDMFAKLLKEAGSREGIDPQ